MAWLVLVLAGFLEVGWAVGLKSTEGFTRPWPTIATVAAMVVSVLLLGVAMRTLPVGTAYAVWSGIGTVGALAFGMMFLGDPVTMPRVVCSTLIVVGIVGLKLAE